MPRPTCPAGGTELRTAGPRALRVITDLLEASPQLHPQLHTEKDKNLK